MAVHQLVVSASPGDAVTNEALALRALLRELGESELYARYHDPALAGVVRPLADFGSRPGASPDDVLVFHASIGDADVEDFLGRTRLRLVLRYHNISPASSYRTLDPAFAALLDAGRDALVRLRERTALALAVSEYNAEELRQAGYGRVAVAPLVGDVRRLTQVTPSEPTARHFAEAVDGDVVLFVGQLLPHKRPDLLVQAYHVLVTYLRPGTHLVLVGAGRLPAYRRAIEDYVHGLNLPDAWVAGAVSDEELAAFYQAAGVFVTTSEHEGFCAPLLEAMSFGVPVVAQSCAAIPETAGDAALLLPAGVSPLLVAEAVAEVLADAALRETLIVRGHARVGAFGASAVGRRFLDNLRTVL